MLLSIESEYKCLMRAHIESEYPGISSDQAISMLDEYRIRNCILPEDVGLNEYVWSTDVKMHISDCTGVVIYGITGDKYTVMSIGQRVCVKQIFSTSNSGVGCVPLYIGHNENCYVKIEYPILKQDEQVEFELVGVVIERNGRSILNNTM